MQKASRCVGMLFYLQILSAILSACTEPAEVSEYVR